MSIVIETRIPATAHIIAKPILIGEYQSKPITKPVSMEKNMKRKSRKALYFTAKIIPIIRVIRMQERRLGANSRCSDGEGNGG